MNKIFLCKNIFPIFTSPLCSPTTAGGAGYSAVAVGGPQRLEVRVRCGCRSSPRVCARPPPRCGCSATRRHRRSPAINELLKYFFCLKIFFRYKYFSFFLEIFFSSLIFENIFSQLSVVLDVEGEAEVDLPLVWRRRHGGVQPTPSTRRAWSWGWCRTGSDHQVMAPHTTSCRDTDTVLRS